VDECVSAVERYVKPDVGSPAWRARLVGLTAAARSLATVGLNAVGVLRCVMAGQLDAYYPAHESLVLGKITFAPARLEALAVKIKADHGWITREWIAHRMGVKEVVVAKWVRSGLLVPVATFGPAQYFSEAMVVWLFSHHMMTAEAAKELGVRPQTLLRWVQKGRIKPVAGPGINKCHRYLFRREDVERLRPENRLTAPELAERMGISRGHVLRLVRQGQLRAVSGPGIDGCQHFLFAGSLEEGERLRSAVS
jgi:predicted site-specific integrase-resolvase